jgi:hypothetical protein
MQALNCRLSPLTGKTCRINKLAPAIYKYVVGLGCSSGLSDFARMSTGDPLDLTTDSKELLGSPVGFVPALVIASFTNHNQLWGCYYPICNKISPLRLARLFLLNSSSIAYSTYRIYVFYRGRPSSPPVTPTTITCDSSLHCIPHRPHPQSA